MTSTDPSRTLFRAVGVPSSSGSARAYLLRVVVAEADDHHRP